MKGVSLIAISAAIAGLPVYSFAQQPPAEAPEMSVSMDVAKARVEKVKALLAIAATSDAVALAKIVAPNAVANIRGKESPLSVSVINGLKDCARRGSFQVNEDQVVFHSECSGSSMSENTTVVVDFLVERIAKVEAFPTIFVPPPPPPLPSGAR